MRLSDIDLRLLRVFKVVAEQGGIVKAQSTLGINQPTISSHIANLEGRLDARLCNRGPQGFSLTPSGKAVLQETNKLLDYLDTYTTKLEKIGKTSERTLKIGVIDCLAADPNNPLHLAIRATEKALGRIELQIGVYDFLDCLTELRAGRIDLAIAGFDEVIPDDIQADHLFDETSGLFCAPDHICARAKGSQAVRKALLSSKISAQSFVLDPIGSELNMLLLNEDTDVSVGLIEASAHMILAGTHVGLMPVNYAQYWVQSGQMVRLAPQNYHVTSHFHLAHFKGRALNQAAQTLCQMLNG